MNFKNNANKIVSNVLTKEDINITQLSDIILNDARYKRTRANMLNLVLFKLNESINKIDNVLINY